jgi:putative membrane protein
MPPEYRAVFSEWSPPVFLTMALLLCAIVYARGWFAIRRTRAKMFPVWRLASFLLGLGVIWLSIASPLDGFADVLLSAHMIEHLLLMSFVPPLLLIGYPVVPLMRGLPRVVRNYLLGPLLRFEPLRSLGHFLTTPIVAWLVMNLIFLGWHVPTAYDFALDHEHWHEFEHACFLGASLLFWLPLVLPWPSRQRHAGWHMLIYLVSADIVNTMLSAFLAFCDRPIYEYYLREPNPFHISPLSDQITGAVIMWVVGSLVFLFPALYITFHLLQRGLSAPEVIQPDYGSGRKEKRRV